MPMATPKRRRTKYTAGPWMVKFTQINERGQSSRPIIIDVKGKRVRATKAGNAVVMGAAPELYEALEALADNADFLVRVLRCEHPLFREPEQLARAKALLTRVRRDLLIHH
jgi:hypothetical protein